MEDDWTTVNKKLREHGLHPVKLQHPADVHHTSGIYAEILIPSSVDKQHNSGIC